MVILLDLNYTLVGNSPSRRGNGRFVGEKYREWLVDLLRQLRPERIVLVTVRTCEHKEWTLRNIADELGGWQPDECHFRDRPELSPPQWKQLVLQERLWPRFGRDGSRYLAVESNLSTLKMYTENGIRALKVFPSDDRAVNRPSLPLHVT